MTALTGCDLRSGACMGLSVVWCGGARWGGTRTLQQEIDLGVMCSQLKPFKNHVRAEAAVVRVSDYPQDVGVVFIYNNCFIKTCFRCLHLTLMYPTSKQIHYKRREGILATIKQL